MRTLFVLAALVGCAGCGRKETTQFTLYQDQVKRIEGCHIVMHAAPGRGDIPFAVIRSACGVEESALQAKEWWGNQPQPLAYSARLGDCLLLGETFYCAEEIKLGEVTFKATYKWASKHQDHLQKIQ